MKHLASPRSYTFSFRKFYQCPGALLRSLEYIASRHEFVSPGMPHRNRGCKTARAIIVTQATRVIRRWLRRHENVVATIPCYILSLHPASPHMNDDIRVYCQHLPSIESQKCKKLRDRMGDGGCFCAAFLESKKMLSHLISRQIPFQGTFDDRTIWSWRLSTTGLLPETA